MPETFDGKVMDGVRQAYVPGPGPLAVDPGLLFWEGEAHDVDPVAFEVIRHNLWHVNEEHGETIVKVSGSPIAVFGQDFDPCIMDERGDFLFFGPYYQVHAGMQDLTVKWILENRSASPGIHDGDIWLHNDPWVGTTHQSDAATMCPVFVDGRLFCWTGSTLHFVDVGGPTPGGWCPDAETVWDEPPPMPPVKIVERGELRRDVEDLWIRRSRVPDLMALDLRAVIAGNRIARERILRLVERYGAGMVKAAMRKTVDDAERRFVAKMNRLPDGVWREQCFLEGARPGDRRAYRCMLTLTKEGTELTFSNEGTDHQVGSLNITFAGWRGAVLAALGPLLCYDSLFAIGGALRHARFRAVPGTITCAEYPASVSNGGAIGALCTIALTNNVLAKMMAADPELRGEATAATGISQWPVTSLFGRDQRGRDFSTVILDWYLATMGAQSSRDGVNTGGVYWGPYHTAPNVEQVEQTSPVLYLYRNELPDSQGAGMFRSGTGPGAAWTPYGTDEIVLNVAACGVAVPTAPGLLGGFPGIPNRVSVLRGSDLAAWHERSAMPDAVADLAGEPVALRPKERNFVLKAGDVFHGWPAGGAGYGDPLERDPELVARDIELGEVTPAVAGQLYGVVLDTAGAVNGEATQQTRLDLRRARIGREPATDARPPDAVLFRIGHSLAVVARSEPSFACARCGRSLGSAAGNYKIEAAIRERPLGDVGPRFNDPDAYVDDRFLFREYSCPACALLLDTEVARAGDGPLHDMSLHLGNEDVRVAG